MSKEISDGNELKTGSSLNKEELTGEQVEDKELAEEQVEDKDEEHEPEEDYSAKIAELDEELNAIKQREIEEMRAHVLEISNVDDRYLKYIKGETPEEVKDEITELSDRFGGLIEVREYVDPSPFNGGKSNISISTEERAKELA